MIRLRILHRHLLHFNNAKFSSINNKYRPFLHDLLVCRLNLDLMDYPELNSKGDVDKVNNIYNSCKKFIMDSKDDNLNKKSLDDAILKQLMDQDINLMQQLKIIELFGDDFLSPSLNIVHQITIINLLKNFGNSKQKELYIPELKVGNLQGLFITAKPFNSSSCETNIVARLSEDGIHYNLNGLKLNVPYYDETHLFVVIAEVIDNSQLKVTKTAFLISSDSIGVTHRVHAEQYPNTNHLKSCDMLLTDVVLSIDNILGPVDYGEEIARKATIAENLVWCSICSGMQKSILEKYKKFANERHVFGLPLSGYDHVKEELVSIYIDGYLSESMTYFIGGHIDNDNKRDWLDESLTSKIFCKEAVVRSSNKLMQLLSHNGLYTTPHLNIDRLSQSLLYHESDIGQDRILIARHCIDHFLASDNHLKTSPLLELRHRLGLLNSVQCYSSDNSLPTSVSKHLHPLMAALSQKLFGIIRDLSLWIGSLNQPQEEDVFNYESQSLINDEPKLSHVSRLLVDLWPVLPMISRVSRAISLDMPTHKHQTILAYFHMNNLRHFDHHRVPAEDIVGRQKIDLLALRQHK